MLDWMDNILTMHSVTTLATLSVVTLQALSLVKEYTLKLVFNAEREPVVGGAVARDGAPTCDAYGCMRLVANGKTTVWPPSPQQYAMAPTPMQVTVVAIPTSLTKDGKHGARFCE
jgi:hypothetical protein